MQNDNMLMMRVQLTTGQEYVVETPLTIEQFDDAIKFANPTDFIIARHGIRLQISKILTHQPIGKTKESETNNG